MKSKSLWLPLMALVSALTFGGAARADAQTADGLIKQVSTDVLDAVKADKSIKAGDVQKVIALVDARVMPHVNFQRMTSSASAATGARPRRSSRSACRTSSRPCSFAPTRARWPR